MKLCSVKEADVRRRNVLLRVDFNVPLEGGKVAEDSRIRAALPTLNWLLEHGAKVAICSHLGRPKGVTPAFSLAPVAVRLGELWGRSVPLLPDCVGEEVQRAMDDLQPGGIVVLENVRFHPEEEKNDLEFAAELAKPFDIFVNDAFATAHRAHASNVGVTKHLPAYAGFLMEREVEVLSALRENPRRPYYILVGGKKAEDKLGLLTDLLDKVDGFLIGGGVAFTFLKAKGHAVGKSVVDESLVETVAELARQADARSMPILLPEDVVVAEELSARAVTKVVRVDKIPDGWMGLDIGPRTVQAFVDKLRSAGTVVWTGPMGAFEFPKFAKGTAALAQALADSGAFTVVGGGETGEAVVKFGLADKFGHLSTGGGATLDFLRGEPLPALEPLRVA